MKLNYGKTFLLGFGFFGVSVIWSVYNSYVPVFLQQKFNMAAGFIGIFMTLDNIASLFIQPLVGAYSDRLRTPIGRRLPFILIGAPIAALAFIFLPVAKSLFMFFLAASVLLLSMAIWRTPVVALMPDITPSKHRSPANGIINLMGGLGSIIAFLIGATLYEMNPSNPFYLGAALVVVSAVLVFIFIREPSEFLSKATHLEPVSEKTDDVRPQGLLRSVKKVIQDPDKSSLRILIAIFLWFVAYNGIEAFFTLYTVNQLGLGEADGSRLLGQMSLIFVLMALPAGYIGKALGRRRTILIGIAGMAIGIALFYFMPSAFLAGELAKVPVLGAIRGASLILFGLGLFWALININSLPMVVDMTTDVNIGTFTGMYYLFSTMAAILGPIMYGWIIQLSNNEYRGLMLLSPLFMIGAFISMAGVRKGEAKPAHEANSL